MTTDFHRLIRALDHSVTDGSRAIPTGRAYHNGAAIYADRIHVQPFAESPVPGLAPVGGLYMGTAGLINLAYLDALRPDHAILYDVNPFQTIFWNVILSAARHNEQFAAFRRTLDFAEPLTRRIIARRMPDIAFSARGSWTEALQNGEASLTRRAFLRSSAPLSSALDALGIGEHAYMNFRAMSLQNRIGTLTLDLFDRDGWRQLAGRLAAAHRSDPAIAPQARVIYVSSAVAFARGGSDWTGRALPRASLDGPCEMMAEGPARIIDNTGIHRADQFARSLKEDRPWPSPFRIRSTKGYAPAAGAGRSDRPSI